MKGYTIDQVRAFLHNHVLDIQFKKKDGTLRNMLATTNPLYLPEPVVETEDEAPKKKRNPPKTIVTCFDVEAKAWRSFRFSNLKSVAVTDMPVFEFTEE